MSTFNNKMRIEGFESLVQAINALTPTTAESIGELIYNQTAAEAAAGVTPTAYRYPPGDVRRYGAVGDGSTNDATAIQAAFTANVDVYFPPQNFVTSAAITASANTVVRGHGATLTQSSSSTSGLILGGDNITVDGLKVVGNNSGTASIGAIYASGRSFITVKNCRVQNWIYGIQLRGCKNYKIQNNYCWGGTYDSSAAADIFVYGNSGTPSERGIITGNFCLSNNDSGISVDTNSGDKDTVISGNVVYPLQSDGVTALADANNRRRYGIHVGYNGTANSRAVVSGNLVKDVPYAGIYMNAATIPVGDVAISGNVVVRCGFGTLYPSDASLRAGIWVNGGADSITANVVADCTTAGIKVAPDYTYSATNQPRAIIASNNVARTAGYGIWLTNKPHGYLVHGNRVINSTNYNIYYETSGADGGNCVISNNHIDTTATNIPGIAVANSLGGYPVDVISNVITGDDNTTNNEFNSGIWFQGEVRTKSNCISTFHRGINRAETVSVRDVVTKCDGNVLKDCAFGINCSGDGPWLCESNTFDNCTTPLNGAAIQGVFLQAGGVAGVIHTSGNATPTVGTWAQGDHVARQNQAAGSAKGWYCTTAGTPGTWTSEGNL